LQGGETGLVQSLKQQIDAEGLEQPHSGDIIGAGQSGAHAHRTVILFVIVMDQRTAPLPARITLHVSEQGSGRKTVLEGQGIGERFDRRAGLPQAAHAVHLSLMKGVKKVTRSHPGLDRTAVILKDQHRGIGDMIRGELGEMAIHQLFDTGLQSAVEGGMNLVLVRSALLQHHLTEMGGRKDAPARSHLDRLRRSITAALFRNHLLPSHRRQNPQLAFPRTRHAGIGIVAARRLRQSGQKGRFRQRELTGGLLKIEPACRRHAKELIAEGGAVEIVLEDLLLAQPELQAQGEQGFGRLDVPSPRQMIDLPCQLLGQGRTAGEHLAATQIQPGRPEKS